VANKLRKNFGRKFAAGDVNDKKREEKSWSNTISATD